MIEDRSPSGQDTWRIFRIMAEFVEAFELLSGVDNAVSIFGSARTKPTDPYYKACEETARLLAKKNIAVITGGGPGIMEAGNKGAFEAGGTSIGLNISLPQEQEGNKYQTVSVDFHYFYARKVMFTKYASGFICFPGGFGTMDEFFEILTLVQTLKVKSYPIVLYGTEYWSGLADWLKKTLSPSYIDAEDMDIFRFADTPKDAVDLIVKGMKRPWWRPEDEQLLKEPPKRPAIAGQPVTSDTGEGTRYGTRPRRTDKKHAKSRSKPEQ